MSDAIHTGTDARGVLTLTLARPDRHNALSAEMMDAITAEAARIQADPSVRLVVLTGAGASFCAGGDLGWMRAQMGADAATRRREAWRLAEMLRALHRLDTPLIGRAQGSAFGGGVGLLSVCDASVGVHGARFGLTETRLGLIPATIGPYVVARLGAAQARRMVLTPRLFDADEAVALGLLTTASASDALDDAVAAEVAPFLDAAPGAVAAGKRLLRRLGPAIDDALVAETVDALVARWESAEAAAGIEAFFDRRPPPWQG